MPVVSECGNVFGGGPVKTHFGLNISPVVGLEDVVLDKDCRWGRSESWMDI